MFLKETEREEGWTAPVLLGRRRWPESWWTFLMLHFQPRGGLQPWLLPAQPGEVKTVHFYIFPLHFCWCKCHWQIIDLTEFILRVVPGEMKILLCVLIGKHLAMRRADRILSAPNYEQLKCPSTGDCVGELWESYTMEHCAVTTLMVCHQCLLT